MFTGIITSLGKLSVRKGSVFTFVVDKSLLKKVDRGTSIGVNGVCVTVLEKPTADYFSVEIMPETERKTNMQDLKVGDLVNLELPATLQTFLSGHIVQGHVDGIGKIKAIIKEGNSHLFTFSLPSKLTHYLVPKGSITINGISLTVIDVVKATFTVGIIPHTWKNTMLHTSQVGDMVNIEVDVLAKYVERLLQKNTHA